MFDTSYLESSKWGVSRSQNLMQTDEQWSHCFILLSKRPVGHWSSKVQVLPSYCIIQLHYKSHLLIHITNTLNPLRLKTCEWCLCTEVLYMLNLCVRTCLQQKHDLALGQLCFCWTGRAKFLFLTHYETESWSGTAQTQPPAAEVGRAVFPVLSKQCQGGRADTSSKCLQRPSPGGEGAYSWAGLDTAWVFLAVCQGISSWHCCWPEECKITIFSQGSCPQVLLCSVSQRNISKGPRSFLLQTLRKESHRQPDCEWVTQEYTSTHLVHSGFEYLLVKYKKRLKACIAKALFKVYFLHSLGDPNRSVECCAGNIWAVNVTCKGCSKSIIDGTKDMQKGIKRCRKSRAALTSASVPAQCHCLCWQQKQRDGGEGGGGLHNYCLLSSSLRINFQAITYFPTHADTHTSLIQRGFISYHLRNHYQNTDTICFRVVCGSPVMANAQTQKQPQPSCPTGDNVQCSQLIFL